MNSSHRQPGRHMIKGTVSTLLAEALLLPTSVVTAAVLTRRLGPEGYGYLTLASTLVNWVEVGLRLLLSSVAVKLVSESENWQPVGTAFVRLYLGISSFAAIIVWFSAPFIASVLSEPLMVPYFRLLALEVPLFSLAQAHRDILLGMGRFSYLASVRATRWLVRMILIVMLVEMGFSVPGAIVGAIGALAAEVAVARLSVRPSLFRKAQLSGRALWSLGGPIFLSAISVYLLNRIDIVAFKLLGGTAEQAGLYGAAQTLSFVPGALAVFFPSILLGALNRLRSAGDNLKASEIALNSLRALIWLVPFAGIVAGASREIVPLFFGPKFLAAAPLFSLLIFGVLSAVMISVACAILTAANRIGWTVALAGPLVPLAVLGHWVMIPRLGSLGASLVTTTIACLGAIGGLIKVCQVWNLLPPLGTLTRSLFLCALAFAAAAWWPVNGLWLFVKLPLIGLAIGISFFLLGEFRKEEIALALSMITWNKSPRRSAG